jgi:hypothetical protein
MSFIPEEKNIISVVNSTTVLLGSSATFTGAWEQVIDQNICKISIIGDNQTDGVLWFDVSHDGGVTINGSIPSTINDASFQVPVNFNLVESHIRVRYVNGTTAQTGFFGIQTKFTNKGPMELLTSVGGIINDQYPTSVTKTVTTGKDPNSAYINTPASGTVDALSTTTPLGISGIWDSGWQDVRLYSEIKVSMTTDEAPSSCFLQLSHDGITIDTSLSLPPQLNGGGNYTFLHSLNPSLPFFKIVYTNGVIAQTVFKFKTTLLVNSGAGFVSRATQELNRYTDVKNIRIVNSPVQDRNFSLINYQEAKRVIGRNAEVPGAGFETIYSGADNGLPAIYPTITAVEPLRVRAGGNANDAIAGTGARKVELCFLDANYNEVIETLDLAGASASASTSVSATALIDAKVIEWGTFQGTNDGAIIIENETTNDPFGAIGVGVGRMQSALTVVPAGKTMYIQSITPAVGSGNTADISLFSFKDLSDQTAPLTAGKFIEWEVVDFGGAVAFNFETFLKFDEKTFIRFDAKRNSGSGNAFISLEFNYILIDN